MGKRTIDIELNYKTNMANLQETKKALQEVINQANENPLNEKFQEAAEAAKAINEALSSSFNNKLGQLDFSKLSEQLYDIFGSIEGVQQDLARGGEVGVKSFDAITKTILKTNIQLKQSNKFLDEMAKSFFNSAKWATTTAAVNTITSSVQKAWNYSLKLDKSLNEIRIVTGKSADEMDRFALTANKAAKELGASTLDYTKAALIYYQQGLGEEEVQARANVTLKVANVTGQSGDEVSEQLTAVWNGYKVSADEAELYMDKLSAVAAATASDLEELSTGMAKVASAANTMGVDIDQLNAQIATIVSVTRQAPESVGTALKTIYARMSDIEAGTEEEGVTLGNYTSQMAEMGVKVLDSQGKLRDMGDVIEEVGNKWKTYSREQQVALAQTMAGTRQYNNLVSLFDNWSMYTEALDTSKNSAGELQRQQDIYMESTEAHLQQLATEAERTYNILFDDSAVKTMTSALTGMLSVLNSLFAGLGGGTSALSFLGLGAIDLFSSQISNEIIRLKNNKDIERINEETQKAKKELEEALKATEKAYEKEGQSYFNIISQNQRNRYSNLEGNLSTTQKRTVLQAMEDQEVAYKNVGVTNEIKNILKESDADSSTINSLLNSTGKSFEVAIQDFEGEMNRNMNVLDRFFDQVGLGKGIDKLIERQSKLALLSDLNGQVPQEAKESTDKAIKEDIKKLKGQLGQGNETEDESLRRQIEALQDIIKLKQEIRKINKELKNDENYNLDKIEEEIEISYQDFLEVEGPISEEAKKALDELVVQIKETQKIDIYDYQKFIEQLEEKLNKIRQRYEGATSALEIDVNLLKKNGKKGSQTINEFADEQKVEAQKNEGEIASILNSEEAIVRLKDFISAGATFINSLNIVANGFRILGDDSIEAGEKVQQLVSIFSVGAIQIIKNWGALEKAGKKVFRKDTWASIGNMLTTSINPYIAAAAIAVTAVTALTLVIVKYGNRAKEAAEAASKTAQETTANFNTLKQEAESFKETISSWEDGVEGLKELQKGTEEYEEALKKANEQAKKLIETYGLYDKYSYQNGVLTIQEDALENIQKSKNDATTQAERAKYTAAMVANEKTQDYDLGKIVNSFTQLVWSYGTRKADEEYREKISGHLFFTEEDAEKVLSFLKDIKEEDEVEYSRLMNTPGALQDEISLHFKETYLGEFADQIQNCSSEFNDLILTMEEAEKANSYYAQQLSLIRIKGQFGEEIEKIATDEEGNVNTILAESIERALSKTKSEEVFASGFQGDLEDTGLTSASFNEFFINGDQNKAIFKQGEAAFLEDNATKEDKEKLKQEMIEYFGSDLSSDEELLKTYARVILKKSEAEIAQMDVVKKNLVDREGNTIVQGDSQDARNVVRAATGNAFIQDKIMGIWDETAQSSRESNLKILEEIQTSAAEAGASYGVNWSQALIDYLSSGEWNLSELFGEIDETEREELLGLAQNGESFLSYLGVSEEQLQHWGKTGEEAARRFYSALKDDYDLSSFLKSLKTKISDVSDVISSLSEGKILTTEQLSFVKQLEGEYLDLATIQDRTSGAYLNKLQEINEKLEDQQTQIEQAQVNELIAEVDFTADTEDLTNTLEEIAKADYEVLVAIKADAQTDFDNMVNEMSNIQTAAEKIGENFVVAASDLEEINDVFPGIIRNMTLLEDGSVQLKETEVLNAMATAQKLVGIDTDKTVELLENEKVQLEGKQQAAQKIADIAQQMVEGEELNEDYQAQLNAALSELKQDNAETTSDYEQETQVDVVDASIENSTAMAKNYTEAYKKMAEDSASWAKAAKHNMLVAVSGIGKASTGYFSQDYTATQKGLVVDNAEKGKIQDNEDLANKTQQDWERVQAYYQNLADSYGEGISSIQGKIAELRARTNEFNVKTTGVGLGKGARTEEEIADILEMLEDEADIYHDINIEIKQVEINIKRLQDQQKKFTGQKLVDNLKDQYLQLNEEIDKYSTKINIAMVEQARLQALLADKGVTFAEDGTIANYTQSFLAQKDYVDSLRIQYNNMSKKAQEDFQETLDKAEKDFETFKDNIEDYDEIITDIIPDLEDKIQEAIDKQIEVSISKFNMEIDLRIDTAQATRDWNSFKKTIINGIKDDDILGNAKARLEDFYTYYNDTETGVIQRNTKHVADILFELKEMDDGLFSEYYGDDKAAALEDLKTYYEQLMQDLQGVEEMSEEIRQSYLNMMDEAQQEFDEQIKGYEQIQSLIEHDIKLIQLVYGDKSYDALAKYYEKSEENYNSQIDFARLQVDFWRQQREEAEEGTERWEKARENEEAAIIKLRDLVNTSIENIQDKYLNAIKAIFEELNNKVTSGAGLEYIKEEWDLVKENSEQYLDNINAAYGIQQLQAKYLKAIDETDSISAQKKLNALMEQEIAALEEKDKLSEYDVERANKKYEIALKQIALEEAQQNKTSMRLRRDSQGNYSYQFVANEDDISNAEDELAEARNALYNFDKENYLNNLEEMRQAYEDYQKKMFEAAQINDPEERAKKELLINEQYNELITTLTEKNQTIRSNLYESALDELADLYKENAEDYRNMTQTQKDILMNDLIPQWDGGVQHMADTFAGEGGFTEVCKDAMQQLGEATESYDESLKKIEETAELSFNKIYEGEDVVIDETRDLLQTNEELIESYEDQLDAVQAVINKLEQLAAAHREAAAAAKEYTTAAYEYQTEDSGKSSDEGQKSRDYSYDMTRAIVDGKANDRSTSSIKTDYNRYRKERNTKINNTEDWSGVSSERLDRLFEAYWAGNSDAEKIVMAVYNKEANFTDELLTRYATKFATGGYTGNDEGLAMLHSKELVLNQTDTKNVLGAVSILRDIVSSVGDAVLQRAASLGSNIAAYYGQKTEKQTLEQNVHIEATFPNVTNSTEIEDALNNLMNKASQRALI